jgi:hypothetical protein
MPRGNEDVSITRVTGEPRHWIEYGIFAFVFLTAIAAWYTRRQWESAVDNGHRQLQAYVFPEQANLVWQGSAKPTAAEIVLKNSGQMPAYRLSTATAILVSDHPLQSDLHFPAMPDNHTVMPPGSTALFRRDRTAVHRRPTEGDTEGNPSDLCLRRRCQRDVEEGVLVISVIDDCAIDRALQPICDAGARWASCYALRDSGSVS